MKSAVVYPKPQHSCFLVPQSHGNTRSEMDQTTLRQTGRGSRAGCGEYRRPSVGCVRLYFPLGWSLVRGMELAILAMERALTLLDLHSVTRHFLNNSRNYVKHLLRGQLMWNLQAKQSKTSSASKIASIAIAPLAIWSEGIADVQKPDATCLIT